MHYINLELDTNMSTKAVKALSEVAVHRAETPEFRDAEFYRKESELLTEMIHCNGYLSPTARVFYSAPSQLSIFDSKTGIMSDPFSPKDIDIAVMNPLGLDSKNTNLNPFSFRSLTPSFAPDAPLVYRIEGETTAYINQFCTTPYLEATKGTQKNKSINWDKYPVTNHLFNNVLGEHKTRFVSWLAGIADTKTVTGQAWLITGVEGTGKGLIFNRYIRAIFGKNCIQTKGETMKKFNVAIRNKMLINIDELPKLTKDTDITNVLKNLITEPFIELEGKGTNAESTIENFCNFYITTNDMDSITIGETDRRYNILSPMIPLDQTLSELKDLPREINHMDDFSDALDSELEMFLLDVMSLDTKANRSLYRQVIRTDAKDEARNAHASKVKILAFAIKEGDIKTITEIAEEVSDAVELFDAETFLKTIIERRAISNMHKISILGYFHERSTRASQAKLWSQYFGTETVAIKSQSLTLGKTARFSKIEVGEPKGYYETKEENGEISKEYHLYN